MLHVSCRIPHLAPLVRPCSHPLPSYFIVLLFITMRRQIQHMYAPTAPSPRVCRVMLKCSSRVTIPFIITITCHTIPSHRIKHHYIPVDMNKPAYNK